MAYITLAELKAFVGIPTADTGDDALLTRALDAAELQINQYTGRLFGQDASVTTRYYTATTNSQVTVDPFATLAGLVVETDELGDGTFETTWTIDTGFRVAPYNAAPLGQPWTELVAMSGYRFPTSARGVKVTAKFGWATIPATVAQATLIQASRLWKRKDAPFGIAGTPEFGSELRLFSALDPDVQSLLRPYRKMWVVSA